MFWLLVALFCIGGCLTRESQLTRSCIAADSIIMDGNLTDPFNVEIFSRIEHFFETSCAHDSIKISILSSKYSYEQRKLVKLDLCIYQVGKATGFRIIFSNLEDRGNLTELISNWINSFLIEKFGKVNDSSSKNEVIGLENDNKPKSNFDKNTEKIDKEPTLENNLIGTPVKISEEVKNYVDLENNSVPSYADLMIN